jgi:hypothetical protein
MFKELGFIKSSAKSKPSKPAPKPAAKPTTTVVADSSKSSRSSASEDNGRPDDTDMLGGGDVSGKSRGSKKSRGIRKHFFAGGFSKGRQYSDTPEGSRADEIYASKKEMTQSEYDRYNRQSGGEQIAHTYDSPMDQAKYEAVVQDIRAKAKKLGANAGYSQA